MGKTRCFGWAALGLFLTACGLDAVILGAATKGDNLIMPDPQDNAVIVQSDPALFGDDEQGVAVAVLRADGSVEDTATVIRREASADAAAFHEARFPGTGEYHGLVLWAQKGGLVSLSLIPELLPQDSVLAPVKWYRFRETSTGALSLGVPALAPMGAQSTAITLALFRKVADKNLSLSGVPRSTLVSAVAAADLLLYDSQAGQDFYTLVESVLLCGEQLGPAFVPFAWSEEGGEAGPALTAAFVTAAREGCAGLENLSAATFEGYQRAVADEFVLDFDYDPDQIRVVFQARIDAGLDRNCNPTSPFRWADDGPGKRMFITGGVHPDTPICNETRTSHCITVAQKSAINIAMGNDADAGWQPNAIAMYDDGTHGDDVAGDRVYTITIDMPYWDPATAPDGAGLRLGYKYTWGKAKQVWTGSEEWPGNQRVLELADLPTVLDPASGGLVGDRLIVRHDLFGDESTNKDKQNLLLPSNGGCGLVLWLSDQEANPEQYGACVMDSRENRIDTDGDCQLDAWPTARSVLPIVR